MELAAVVTDHLPEDAAIAAARGRAHEVGLTCVGPDVGSLLATLTAQLDARTVVEIGTGTGVSGLWLLRGMRSDGVLTSIDSEPEHQRQARQAFADAGLPAARTRLIAGEALDVLPRLTDHGYDLVFLDASPTTFAAQLEQARRLTRPGGMIVLAGMLRGVRTGGRDSESVAARAVFEQLASWEGDGLVQRALLPLGDGLLVITVRAPAGS